MAEKITIDGLPGTYEVSDGFFSLPPEEQQKVVEEIYTSARQTARDLPTSGVKAATQYISGGYEGLADIAGAPVDLTNFGLRKAAEGIESLTGYKPPIYSENPIGGSGTFRTLFGEDIEGYGITPPELGYERSRQFGRYTGQGLGTALTMGTVGPALAGTNVVSNMIKQGGQAAVRNPGKLAAAEVVAAKGAQVGGEAGGDAGEKLGYALAERTGGDPERYGEIGRNVGRGVGELAGGLTPAVAIGTADTAARAAMGRPAGAEQLASGAEAFRAAERSGVTPTFGMVGNEFARRAENVAGYVPLAGGTVQRTQARQVSQAGDKLAQIAASRRPPGAVPQTSVADMGENIRTMAGTGAERARSTVSAANEALEAAVGPRAAVPVKGTLTRLQNMIPRTDIRLGDQIQQEIQSLNAMRTEPIDVALQRQLERRWTGIQQRINNIQARRSQGKYVDPDAVDQVNKELQDVSQKMDANMGVPFERLRDWRTNVGVRTDGGPRLSSGQMDQIYSAVTTDMEQMARNRGLLPQFQETMATTRRLSTKDKSTPLSEGRDIPYLSEVASLEQGPAYNRIVVGGKDNWGRLAALQRQSSPDEWGQLSGDILERLGMSPAGQQGAGGDVFSPNTFLTNWNKLSRQSKELLVPMLDRETGQFITDTSGRIVPDAEVMKQLDDLATVTESMRARALAGNPSGTAPAAAILGTGTGAFQAPARVAGSLLATAGGIRALMSETFARTVAGLNPSFQQRVIARLPGATGRAVVEQ